MLVEIKGMQKHYKNFDLNCSLEVNEGCVTGLIGQNGAGKTTIFKGILNLITMDGGDVKVMGKEPQHFTPMERKKIGVVTSGSGFSEYLNIKEIANIMTRFYEKFNKQDFLNQCERFRLPMDQDLKSFSSGMKAKLKVLIAMSYEAGLLILDEPTAGLDVVARDTLLNMLREYMEEDGRAILVSSHISSDLEGLCDDLYMIDEGMIVMHEETDTLLDQYGVLKMDEDQYNKLDHKHLLKYKRENFGYSCLTKEKQFYMENYPEIVIEKGTIDEVMLMMIKGESL